MFAVVKTGGKQYRVSAGDVLKVEKLAGEVGETVKLSDVLAIGGEKPAVGAPLVAGASVSAEIIAQSKSDKVIVFKKTRRQTYRRKRGHRQLQTVLRVMSIAGEGGAKLAEAAAKAPAKAKPVPAEKAEKKVAATPKTKALAAKAAEKKPAAKKPAAKKTKE